MEGEGGHGRHLDRMILEKGYTLYNVSNLKLARFQKIFPGPAKTTPWTCARSWSCFTSRTTCPWPRTCCRRCLASPR